MHLIEQGDEGVGGRDGPVIGVGAAYRGLKENGQAGEIDLARREIEGFREIAARVVRQAAKRLRRIRRSGCSRNKRLAFLRVEKQSPPLLVKQGCPRFFVSIGESGDGEAPLLMVRVKLKMEKAPEGPFPYHDQVLALNSDVEIAVLALHVFVINTGSDTGDQTSREHVA